MDSFEEFEDEPREFWAYVKLASELIGYSKRGRGESGLRSYDIHEVVEAFNEEGVSTERIWNQEAMKATSFGNDLVSYLNKRKEVIEGEVTDNLMNREEAKHEFEKMREEYDVDVPIKMNKQKGDMKHPAYLTCMVNIMTAVALEEHEFVPEPRGLTVAQKGDTLLRTFSRRMDGAYPTRFNPKAIWEIKEYYDNSTFGSRIADGVYETMLDGEEVEELEKEEDEKIFHYLIIDDYQTWWENGRSYLCRIVDIVNMGLVDEVIIGREVISRWPEVIKEIKLEEDEYEKRTTK